MDEEKCNVAWMRDMHGLVILRAFLPSLAGDSPDGSITLKVMMMITALAATTLNLKPFYLGMYLNIWSNVTKL